MASEVWAGIFVALTKVSTVEQLAAIWLADVDARFSTKPQDEVAGRQFHGCADPGTGGAVPASITTIHDCGGPMNHGWQTMPALRVIPVGGEQRVPRNAVIIAWSRHWKTCPSSQKHSRVQLRLAAPSSHSFRGYATLEVLKCHSFAGASYAADVPD